MKQRLIGAAVLVALAVIFLPMLIGGPEREAGQDTRAVSLEVPERDGRNFETRDLALPQAAPQLAPSPSATVDSPAPVTAPGGDRVATVDTTGTPPRLDAVSGQPVGTPSPAAPAPSPRPVASAPVPAPAAAAPSPRSAVPSASANGQWAVHLGVYANAGNAEALVSQLKAKGLPAYGEAATLDNGKAARRVRVGPFAQRSEAESARLSVAGVRKDVPASVVSLEGDKAPPPAVRPAPGAGFAVQIGALRSQADANLLRDRARQAGFAAFVESVSTTGGTLWRVRVGPEAQRAGADRLKGDIKARLGIDGNVVAHP